MDRSGSVPASWTSEISGSVSADEGQWRAEFLGAPPPSPKVQQGACGATLGPSSDGAAGETYVQKAQQLPPVPPACPTGPAAAAAGLPGGGGGAVSPFGGGGGAGVSPFGGGGGGVVSPFGGGGFLSPFGGGGGGSGWSPFAHPLGTSAQLPPPAPGQPGMPAPLHGAALRSSSQASSDATAAAIAGKRPAGGPAAMDHERAAPRPRFGTLSLTRGASGKSGGSGSGGGGRPHQQQHYYSPSFGEDARASVLHALKIRFTEAKAVLEPVVDALSRCLGMPVVAASTTAKDKAHMLAGHNVRVSGPAPRDASLGVWVLVPPEPELVVITDLRKDGRTALHPLVVKEPHLRSLVAAPIILSSGMRIGNISASNYVPCAPPSPGHAMLAVNCAELIARYLEQPRTADFALLDVSQAGWKVLFAGQAWAKMTGVQPGDMLWDKLKPAKSSVVAPETMYNALVEDGQTFMMRGMRADTSEKLTLDMRSAHDDLPFPGQRRVKIQLAQQQQQQQEAGDDVELAPTGSAVGTQGNEDSSGGGDLSRFALYLCFLQDGSGSGSLHSTGDNALSSSSLLSGSGSGENSTGKTPFPDVQMGALLGMGSFAKVFHGWWNGQHVAIKVAHHDVPLASAAHSARIASALEGIVGARLDHPNIIKTYKYAISNGVDHQGQQQQQQQAGHQLRTYFRQPSMSRAATWMVLEYMDKGSLHDAICSGGLFRSEHSLHAGGPHMRNILAALRQVATGMAYLHGCGICHGDLSANNIMLCSGPLGSDLPFVAKVVDFGLSQVLEENAPRNTLTFGTPHFLPIENVRDGVLGPETDVYSFGVIMWMLFTSSPPYPGLAPMAVVAQKLTNMSSPVLPDDTPKQYKDLFELCTSVDPAERPPFVEVQRRVAAMEQALEWGEFGEAPDFSTWGPAREKFYTSIVIINPPSAAAAAAATAVAAAAPGSGASSIHHHSGGSSGATGMGRGVILPSPSPTTLELRQVGADVHARVAIDQEWQAEGQRGPPGRFALLPDAKLEAERCAALRAAGYDLRKPAPELEPVTAAIARELGGAGIVIFGYDGLRQQHAAAVTGMQVQGSIPHSVSFPYFGLLPDPPQLAGILDMTRDERTSEIPGVVAPPFMRSVLVAPLTTPEGPRLGNLTAVWYQPLEPSALTLQRRALFRNAAHLGVMHAAIHRHEARRSGESSGGGGDGSGCILQQQAAQQQVLEQQQPVSELQPVAEQLQEEEPLALIDVRTQQQVNRADSAAGSEAGFRPSSGSGADASATSAAAPAAAAWRVVYATQGFTDAVGAGAGDELLRQAEVEASSVVQGASSSPSLQQQCRAVVQAGLPFELQLRRSDGRSVMLEMRCASDSRAFNPEPPMLLDAPGQPPLAQGRPAALYFAFLRMPA